jgi:glutamate--cysteine ligase
MELHYRSTGQSEAGLAMMCATAALQVNLQAGRTNEWSERVALTHALGPVFIAIAANSPWLSGKQTRWKSLRRRVWSGLDPHSCAPLDWTDDPAASWASFALQAPATLVTRADGAVDPVGMYVPFLDWVTGAVPLGGRRPTINDLQTHLSTLFPPVRLRGYLEIRYLDTVGPRWWPAVAAALTTLIDVPTAADAAAEAVEETATLWEAAAQFGLSDDRLAGAAQRCMEIAAAHAPNELRFAVEDLASLVAQRRSPGDEFADRVDEVGALAAFEELARA